MTIRRWITAAVVSAVALAGVLALPARADMSSRTGNIFSDRDTIRQAQEILVQENYLEPGEFDAGKMDNETDAALRRFQREHFKNPTGVLDHETMSLLLTHARTERPDEIAAMRIIVQEQRLRIVDLEDQVFDVQDQANRAENIARDAEDTARDAEDTARYAEETALRVQENASYAPDDAGSNRARREEEQRQYERSRTEDRDGDADDASILNGSTGGGTTGAYGPQESAATTRRGGTAGTRLAQDTGQDEGTRPGGGTMEGGTMEDEEAQAPDRRMPRTGSTTAPFALAGLLLAASGLALLRFRRA